MGLDITAYSGLVRVADYTEGWDTLFGEGDHTSIFVNKDFPSQAAGITRGIYTYEDYKSFRAGSYGGYNRWRNNLSLTMLGVPADDVFGTPPEHQGKPFVELIDFSDCEGTIGPAISAKLAKDFADHQHIADKWPDSYDQEKYAEWRKAFEMAANNGAVCFH